MTQQLAKALLSFFAPAIFFSRLFMGTMAGRMALAASLASAVFVSWSFGDYSASSEIFLFLGAAFFAAYLAGKSKQAAREETVRMEEIQKSKNVLAEGIASHKGVQDALRKKMQRFSQLKQLISSLSLRLAVDEASGIIVNAAGSIVGKSDNAYFFVVDVGMQQLALKAARHRNEREAVIKNKTGDFFDAWVFKQRQPLMIHDVRKDYRFDLEKEGSLPRAFKSLIAVPLVSAEKVIGILRLENSKTSAYLPDDLRLLDIIANIAAVSLQNALLYQRTEELAIRDGLTGAYVQRYFRERLGEEITRALRSGGCVSALMLDIDYFKAYNDRYGHSAGDIVLKKVAGILGGILGGSGDVAARYGGEEFAAIIFNKNKKEAFGLAESIRQRIAGEVFMLRREKTRMTVSIGVANCPEDVKVAEDLIKAADDALYKAKRAGRNRVECR